MIVNYIIGKNGNGLNQGIIMILSSIVGGYMVSDFPKEFLNLFTTPIGQFIAFIIINLAFYMDKNVSFEYIILESLIYMIILQVMKFVINKIYV